VEIQVEKRTRSVDLNFGTRAVKDDKLSRTVATSKSRKFCDIAWDPTKSRINRSICALETSRSFSKILGTFR
jgi:hypothetical protein